MKAANIKSNNFCLMPFTHKYYDRDLIAPCCVNVSGTRTELEMNLMRKKFLEGGYPDSCSKCIDREKIGETSYRLSYLEKFSDLEFEVDDEYNLLNKPSTFDVRLEATCNLKCVMCGPHFSTKWNEDLDIFDHFVGLMQYGDEKNNMNMIEGTKNHSPSDIIPSSKESSFQRLKNFDEILENTDKAKRVEIFGGEPFYMKNALILVNKLSKNPYNLENLELILGTNGYITPNNKLFQKIKLFKNVKFRLSLDGYKEVNDYIRFPSIWDKFCDSINLLKDVGDVTYSVTLSCLNLLDWDNIKDFTGKYNYYMLEEPHFLSINSLHPNVIDQFYNYTRDKKMIEYVKNYYEYEPEMRSKMQLYLKTLDERRHTDSKKILPWCYYE